MTQRLGKTWGTFRSECFVWMRARVYRRLSSLVGEDAPEGPANKSPMGAQLLGARFGGRRAKKAVMSAKVSMEIKMKSAVRSVRGTALAHAQVQHQHQHPRTEG